jgi:integrase/recombinase XerD
MAALFDNPEDWKASPLEGFKGFVQSRKFLELGRRRPAMKSNDQPHPMRASSAAQYVSMFKMFAGWLERNRLTVFDVQTRHILQFLDERAEIPTEGRKLARNSRIRTKYVRMLERVYTHLRVQPNPAQGAAFNVKDTLGKAGTDEAMVILSDTQLDAFMEALPVPDGESAAAWKRRRDRAIQMIMVGAGLKVSEVIGLYLENLEPADATGSLPITVHPASTDGTSREHRTLLRPFAVPEVQFWLNERTRLNIPGQLVFPTDLIGNGMWQSTVFRQTKETFRRAGITASHQGGRTLRNTFAVRELLSGTPSETVREYLGLFEQKSMLTYEFAAHEASAGRMAE